MVETTHNSISTDELGVLQSVSVQGMQIKFFAQM